MSLASEVSRLSEQLAEASRDSSRAAFALAAVAVLLTASALVLAVYASTNH